VCVCVYVFVLAFACSFEYRVVAQQPNFSEVMRDVQSVFAF